MEDAAVMFTAVKDSSRSWNDQFLYLIALMRATDASPAMVLQNIVRHASPRFSPTLLGRYNEQRQDLMMHAQELATPDVEMLALAAISDTAPENDVHRDTLMGLHQRFGHLGFNTVERIARDPLSGIAITDHTRRVCVTCAEGKQTKRKQSKKTAGARANRHRGMRHLQPLKRASDSARSQRKRYLVNFVDHRSNYCRVFASKAKDEATRKFRDFLVFFEKRFSCKEHVLRTDGGGEYRTVELFCQQNGVARQVSEASNQASNGKAERMHRTIFNMVRCMIFESGLAPSFWCDAAEYATYILNRSPTRANPDRQSPLQVLTGVMPSLHDAAADPLVATTPTSTFGDAREFSPYPKNYHEARNGTPVNYWNADANQELQALTSGDARNFMPDTKNYREAHSSSDASHWTAAEQEELEALIANATCTLIKCEPNTVKLHTKWVYKKKRTPTGVVERYKTRLVACRNEQVLGVNYTLTFAAVLEMTSGKVIFAPARIWGVPARHGDVPNPYVKAMTEGGIEIVIVVPKGMNITPEMMAELGVDDVRQIGLRLDRGLYGLKQSGRFWHKLLHETLIELGFSQCITDSCLYFRIDAGGTTLMGTYVDDLLVTGTSTEHVDKFFKEMQEHAIKELLEKTGLAQAHAVRCPIGQEDPVIDDQLLPESPVQADPSAPTKKHFQSLVGSLLWIARCTRPDIVFAVHRATRRTHAPIMQDWKLAKRIARYLAGSVALKLRMNEDQAPNLPINLVCYTDADFAGDNLDRKSVSGAVFNVNGMIVGWACKKQSAVALSTAEAEFIMRWPRASGIAGAFE
ncbi:unnamed protein product [Phytophthora fragariaefolia]|uniref:Unnamed protein product n=1 Tax=Phytophthora fragariaefolia TaxID=1490495 RepID=A0A9W7D5Z7_9STRA|nr:unnamed protein product [Phytophthora fragariaefolia]